MGPLGWQETVFIFVLALLLFGPKKLPELGKTIGKAVTEFRRASNELKATFDREMKTLEQENDSLKEVTSNYATDNYNYDYSQYEYGSDYSSTYGSESAESTATNTSTEGASATQGAESTSATTPEGTVAYGTETAAVGDETTAETVAKATPAEDPAAHASSTAEQYKA
ncbi:MAG TPA: twin-arginine translocase TatA/TatE family subunit [Bryobacteraceae bacterium]|nr:twin-arginine translocase TatA/TatE family subunit [Bryobacteraceae bacterium]